MKRLVTSLVVLAVVATFGCRRSQPAPGPAAAPPAASDVAQPAQTSAAPASSDVVAELPEFPGSTRVAFRTKADPADGWSRVAKVELTTTAAFQAVFDFYQKAIADNGWTVASLDSKPGKARWKLTKGTSVGEVEVDQEKAAVEITLERKDR